MRENLDKNRRNFLKIVLFGGGALILGKILSPTISKFLNGPSVETNFQNFRTVEDKKGLTVYDKNGEEIFQIDKGEE